MADALVLKLTFRLQPEMLFFTFWLPGRFPQFARGLLFLLALPLNPSQAVPRQTNCGTGSKFLPEELSADA